MFWKLCSMLLLITSCAKSPAQSAEPLAKDKAMIGAESKTPISANDKAQSTKENRVSIDLPANLIRLPLARQATSYTCGVSALQSVLRYYGMEFREDELSKKLKANYHAGTAYAQIAKHSQQLGFHVDIHKEMSIAELKALLDKKLPVICLLQAWGVHNANYSDDWQDGHYVVAVGYNEKNIFFMDPSMLGNFAYIPENEFVNRWHDTDGKEKLKQFGMVVSRENSNYIPDVARYME